MPLPRFHLETLPPSTLLAEDLSSLARLAQQDIPLVVLLQKEDAADDKAPWIEALKQEHLRQDLIKTVETWRALLNHIRHSSSIWIYAGQGSCLGHSWELALACDHRLWFGPHHPCGLPEWSADFFPLGGCLEWHQNLKVINPQPVRFAQQWKPLGLIDAIFEGEWDNQLMDAYPWRKQSVDKSPRRSLKDLPSTQLNIQSGTIKQRYLQALKSLSKGIAQKTFDDFTTKLAGEMLVSPPYLAWLGERPSVKSIKKPTISKLFIRVSSVIPPSKSMFRFLDTMKKLTVVCSEPEQLVSALDLLHRRLTFRRPYSQSWQGKLQWAIDSGGGSTQNLIEWESREVIRTSDHSGETHLIHHRTSEDHVDDTIEWTHFTDNGLSQNFLPLIRCLTPNIIKTQPPQTTSVTEIIRLAVLEQLIRISGDFTGDLDAVIQALKKWDWTWAGDPSQWTVFLGSRNIKPFRPIPLGSHNLPRSCWNLADWRQARALAKRSRSEDKAMRSIALSDHMACYLIHLTDLCVTQGWTKDKSDANALCTLATGFPARWGRPLDYLRLKNEKRIRHHIHQFWPPQYPENVQG